MPFQNFDTALFLREYWQKKPLLIRNPWIDWNNPLDPDELAGLACEKDMESRLVTQSGDQWSVEHGPLAEDRFATLGKTHWTLLVQAVDHHVPDVAALLDPFRFVPNWRIDDVMVSYAVDEGSVGPHFDQYDVFLIQGLGKRRWQIGGLCNQDTPLSQQNDLRLLADFETVEEWVLEPGDILYVPPGVAHHGVAVGDDCMTYSVGFRAPSSGDLIESWCDDLLERLSDDDRYTDPNLTVQANPGEITADSITDLHAMITQQLADKDAFARWFGEYNSAPKYMEADWQPEEPIEMPELREALADGAILCRNPASRFSFIRQAGDAILLFVDGQSFVCSGDAVPVAEALCGQGWLEFSSDSRASEATLILLVSLYNHGSIAFDEEVE